jgi:putative membrane protein
MVRWLMRWILNIAAIIFTASVVPGFDVTVEGAIVGSIILGLINATIRPIFKIVTMPINLLTLGLFTLLINGVMLGVVSMIVRGFDIHGFGTAVISALVLTVISSLISYWVKE